MGGDSEGRMMMISLTEAVAVLAVVECILAVLSLRFQAVELFGFNGAEVRGSVDSLEVGADIEDKGEGGVKTNFRRFKISSGVISKSGVIKV